MKSKVSILLSSVLAAFLLSGCALPIFMYAHAKEKRALAASGPQTDYVIDPAPKFLTDDLAVAKARETLAKEGYKTNQWQFTSMHSNQTRRVVRFTREGRFRLYSVRLRGDTVSCHSVRGTQRDFESWSSRPKPQPGIGRGRSPLR
jgi:hypothetical protein